MKKLLFLFFCLSCFQKVQAQVWLYRFNLKDSIFVSKHKIKSVRVTYKDLVFKKKSWQFGDELTFNQNGRLIAYKHRDPKKSTIKDAFYNGGEKSVYDEKGLLKQKSFYSQDIVQFTDFYEYDGADKLLRIIRVESAKPEPVPYQSFSYNAAGQEIEMVQHPNKWGAPRPGKHRKFYNQEGLLTASEFKSDELDSYAKTTAPRFTDSLYYDAAGRIIKEAHYSTYSGRPGSWERAWHSFDQAGRKAETFHLYREDGCCGEKIIWKYNGNNNLTEMVRHKFSGFNFQSNTYKSEDNHFEKTVVKYDKHGILLEEKNSRSDFIASPNDITKDDLKSILRWKTKYYR